MFSFCHILMAAVVAIGIAAAADNDTETYPPVAPYCDLIGGHNVQCDLNKFDGLQGHNPSDLIYTIIQQSGLPDSTFYKNGIHVTCLFQNESFFLDIGGDSVGFHLNLKAEGTICVYVDQVPESQGGGLTLGEIKPLAKDLAEKCNKCGYVSINYINMNETQGGNLVFDWQDDASCLAEDHCIDATKMKKTTASSTATAGPKPSASTKSGAKRSTTATSSLGLVFALAVGILL